eukprot:gene10307-12192_t
MLYGGEQANKEMLRAQIPRSMITYIRLIQTLPLEGEEGTVSSVLKGMLEDGVSVDEPSYVRLLEIVVNAESPQQIVMVFGEMTSQGIVPDQRHLPAIIRAYATLGDVDKCLDLLPLCNEVEDIGSATWTVLLTKAASRRDLANMTSILRQMHAAGRVPSADTYEAMVLACKREEEWDLLIKLFQEAVACGQVTFQMGLSASLACRKTSNLQQSVEVYKDMKSAGLRLDLQGFNSLLLAAERTGDASEIEAVYSDMIGSGIQGDAFTFNTLVAAYAKCGLTARALHFFEEMKSQGILLALCHPLLHAAEIGD